MLLLQTQCDVDPSEEQTKRALCRKRSITAFVCFGLTLLSWAAVALTAASAASVLRRASEEGGPLAVIGFLLWMYVVMSAICFFAGVGTVSSTVGCVFSFKALRLAKHTGLRGALIAAFALQMLSALTMGTVFLFGMWALLQM